MRLSETAHLNRRVGSQGPRNSPVESNCSSSAPHPDQHLRRKLGLRGDQDIGLKKRNCAAASTGETTASPNQLNHPEPARA